MFAHSNNAGGHFTKKEILRPISESIQEKNLTIVILLGVKNRFQLKDISMIILKSMRTEESNRIAMKIL
jgi:hypothetical protein